jgi:hypothetical protein
MAMTIHNTSSDGRDRELMKLCRKEARKRGLDPDEPSFKAYCTRLYNQAMHGMGVLGYYASLADDSDASNAEGTPKPAKKTVAKKATAAKKTVAKKATAAKKTAAKKATAAVNKEADAAPVPDTNSTAWQRMFTVLRKSVLPITDESVVAGSIPNQINDLNWQSQSRNSRIQFHTDMLANDVPYTTQEIGQIVYTEPTNRSDGEEIVDALRQYFGSPQINQERVGGLIVTNWSIVATGSHDIGDTSYIHRLTFGVEKDVEESYTVAHVYLTNINVNIADDVPRVEYERYIREASVKSRRIIQDVTREYDGVDYIPTWTNLVTTGNNDDDDSSSTVEPTEDDADDTDTTSNGMNWTEAFNAIDTAIRDTTSPSVLDYDDYIGAYTKEVPIRLQYDSIVPTHGLSEPETRAVNVLSYDVHYHESLRDRLVANSIEFDKIGIATLQYIGDYPEGTRTNFKRLIELLERYFGNCADFSRSSESTLQTWFVTLNESFLQNAVLGAVAPHNYAFTIEVLEPKQSDLGVCEATISVLLPNIDAYPTSYAQRPWPRICRLYCYEMMRYILGFPWPVAENDLFRLLFLRNGYIPEAADTSTPASLPTSDVREEIYNYIQKNVGNVTELEEQPSSYALNGPRYPLNFATFNYPRSTYFHLRNLAATINCGLSFVGSFRVLADRPIAYLSDMVFEQEPHVSLNGSREWYATVINRRRTEFAPFIGYCVYLFEYAPERYGREILNVYGLVIPFELGPERDSVVLEHCHYLEIAFRNQVTPGSALRFGNDWVCRLGEQGAIVVPASEQEENEVPASEQEENETDNAPESDDNITTPDERQESEEQDSTDADSIPQEFARTRFIAQFGTAVFAELAASFSGGDNTIIERVMRFLDDAQFQGPVTENTISNRQLIAVYRILMEDNQ